MNFQLVFVPVWRTMRSTKFSCGPSYDEGGVELSSAMICIIGCSVSEVNALEGCERLLPYVLRAISEILRSAGGEAGKTRSNFTVL